MSEIIKVLLPFTLIVCLVLNTPFQFGSAQQATFKISGYILDEKGNGLNGARIIFNVPSIVSSIDSDSSGYYEIFAPQSYTKSMSGLLLIQATSDI